MRISDWSSDVCSADLIGFLKRIDPVDQVNVEFAHVHREFANAVDQRSVDARPVAGTVIAKGNLLCLLGEIEGRYGVLTHGLLILLVKFRIFVLYDFAQAELGQFLGNKLLIETSADRKSLG